MFYQITSGYNCEGEKYSRKDFLKSMKDISGNIRYLVNQTKKYHQSR